MPGSGWIVYVADLDRELVSFWVYGDDGDAAQDIAGCLAAGREGLCVRLGRDLARLVVAYGLTSVAHRRVAGRCGDGVAGWVGIAGERSLVVVFTVDEAGLNPDLLALVGQDERVLAGVRADVGLEGRSIGGVTHPLVIECGGNPAVVVLYAGCNCGEGLLGLGGAADGQLPGRHVVQAVDPKAQVARELAEFRAGVDRLCAVF